MKRVKAGAKAVQEAAVDRRYRRVALLTDKPARLQKLGLALRAFASTDVGQVFVWLSVERFHAPSGTCPPYQTMARIEARNITTERIESAGAEALESIRSWDALAGKWKSSLSLTSRLGCWLTGCSTTR